MKISVAICTYNGEKYIEKQLLSILNQTLNVNEIVICDDISKDNTLNIINGIIKQYKNIFFNVIQNKQNLGSIKNFEQALSLCTGDIIFLSDQDDLWLPNKVKKIMNVFINNPKINGVFTDGYLIDSNNNIIENITLWQAAGFYPKREIIKQNFQNIFQHKNIVTGATLAIRKIILKQIFPIPENNNENTFKIHHDYWIAQILALTNSLYYLSEKLIYYRIHQNQQVGFDLKNINKNKYSLDYLFDNTIKFNNYSLYKFQLKYYVEMYSFYKEHYLIYKSLNIDYTKLINYSFNNYKSTKIIMKKKYPIKFRLMRFFDFFTRKRQLKSK